MTINDLRCDFCGRFLAGPSGWPGPHGLPDPRPPGQAGPGSDPGRREPEAGPGRAGGVRFGYHPGAPQFRDNSGLACEPCWADAAGRLDNSVTPRSCASCGQAVTRTGSLHLRRLDGHHTWRLCASDAAQFLNLLRTVEPKLDPATFRFPAVGFPPRASRAG